MSDPVISIIAPFYNEAQSIDEFIRRIVSVMESSYPHFELILIDDGTTDGSYNIVKKHLEENKKIKLIVFSRNYGHEIALTAGIDHAKGDFLIQLDTDLQHPPELIPELIEKAKSGYDIVYARRNTRDYETVTKRVLSRLYYRIASKMTGFSLPDDATNFRIINKSVIHSIKRLKEHNRHLIMMYAYVGFKTTSIPFDVIRRKGSTSKYNYAKLVHLAFDSVISFSSQPLRYIAFFSIFISILLFFYAGFILVQKLFLEQHLAEGIASIIFIMSGLFSILFLFLAVISEYIGRILIESKNRPLYYVREYMGFNDVI